MNPSLGYWEALQLQLTSPRNAQRGDRKACSRMGIRFNKILKPITSIYAIKILSRTWRWSTIPTQTQENHPSCWRNYEQDRRRRSIESDYVVALMIIARTYLNTWYTCKIYQGQKQTSSWTLSIWSKLAQEISTSHQCLDASARMLRTRFISCTINKVRPWLGESLCYGASVLPQESWNVSPSITQETNSIDINKQTITHSHNNLVVPFARRCSKGGSHCHSVRYELHTIVGEARIPW